MQKLGKGAIDKVRVLCITAHTADVSTLTGEAMGGARAPPLWGRTNVPALVVRYNCINFTHDPY